MKLRLRFSLFAALSSTLAVMMLFVFTPVAASGAQVAAAAAVPIVPAGSTVSFMRSVCTATLITAHRGTGVGTNWTPDGRSTEDTIRSALIAYSFGMDQSETDYHQSMEGTYWQIHDDDLTRVTNGRDHRKLRDMTDAQIRAVVLPDGSHLASEEDAASNLKYGPFQGRSGQWEIKRERTSDADLTRFVNVIRAYGLQDQVMITTASQGVGRRLARLAPDIPRYFVWYPNNTKPALRNVSRAFDGINIDASQATRRYVRAAHNHGFNISARNAETSTQWYRLMHRSAATRPYNVLTDVPWRYRRWCNNQ